MPKVLLVEDDNNLREIFEMRLQAEGYDTLTAGNGEEGLTVAMAEKPDLIISDVMMPKLSGFEMLETLRAAPEGKDAKVIMMTALGQAEDQARGEKLGVVKYLVKSQATLDDFARVVREVLPPASDTTPAADNKSIESSETTNKESEKKMPEEPTVPTNPDPATPAPADPATPGEPTVPPPIPEPTVPAPDPAAPGDQQSTAQEQSAVNSQINDFVTTPAADTAAPSTDSITPPAPTTPGEPSPAAADPGASPFTPSEPTTTSNPVATPGAPDLSTPVDSGASTDAPTVPPATPPADNPPATPPQTDAPVPPPTDPSGTI